jgi:pseudouridine kinase
MQLSDRASHGAPQGKRVVVIGGANTDIVGAPHAPLLARDSNPGHVSTSAGGVGRNIAENLARLGLSVDLVTAFGRDEAGAELAAACRLAGVGVSASIVAEDLPSARYLAVVDAAGDLYVAVNDMRVIELLTPEAMAEPGRCALIAGADIVVADANLLTDTLRWLAENVAAPLVVDPVSSAKAGRIADLLSSLSAVTPSVAEAGVILGRAVTGVEDARLAAQELVAAGVDVAYVTCGPAGVAWADASGSGTVAPPCVEVVNTNGAGDAFCAGVVYGMLAGMGPAAAAALGSAVSAITLQDEDTVSAQVDPAAAFKAMEERA